MQYASGIQNGSFAYTTNARMYLHEAPRAKMIPNFVESKNTTSPFTFVRHSATVDLRFKHIPEHVFLADLSPVYAKKKFGNAVSPHIHGDRRTKSEMFCFHFEQNSE